MIIARVYSVDMTHLCVQLKGSQQTIRLRAGSVQEDQNENALIAKDVQGKMIGKFLLHEVAGWWTEDIGV